MFQADAARFVRASPRIVAPSTVYTTQGVGGDSWKVAVWREPHDGSGQYLIAVDTAAGKERDRSVILVIDKRDGKLCAAFVSDTIMADDLARVALDSLRAASRSRCAKPT